MRPTKTFFGTNIVTYLKEKRDNIKAVIMNDYTVGVHKKNGISYHNKKPLMSISRLLKGVNEWKFSTIPPENLEESRLTGAALMVNLERWFKSPQGLEGMEFRNLRDRDLLIKLLTWFKENNVKIIDVEKCIVSGSWIGYIDVVAKQKGSQRFLIEIKTRGSNKPYPSDYLQAMVYHKMCYAIPVMLLIINKNTFKINEYPFQKIFNKGYNTYWKWGEFERMLELLGLPPIEGAPIVKPVLSDWSNWVPGENYE